VPDLRINAGELRRRVTIEQKQPGPASLMGSAVENYAAIATAVPAKLVWLTGDGLYTALQVHKEASVEITIRWNGSVSEVGIRFVDEDGHPYYPVNCIRDERKRWMRLLCKERPDVVTQ